MEGFSFMEGNYWTRQREATHQPFIRMAGPGENYWTRHVPKSVQARAAALRALRYRSVSPRSS